MNTKNINDNNITLDGMTFDKSKLIEIMRRNKAKGLSFAHVMKDILSLPAGAPKKQEIVDWSNS